MRKWCTINILICYQIMAHLTINIYYAHRTCETFQHILILYLLVKYDITHHRFQVQTLYQMPLNALKKSDSH